MNCNPKPPCPRLFSHHHLQPMPYHCVHRHVENGGGQWVALPDPHYPLSGAQYYPPDRAIMVIFYQ